MHVTQADQSGVSEMRRVAGSRHDHVGVLRGRPPLDPMYDATPGGITPRRVDEIRQVLALVDRGLLSEEEFDAQMMKVYGLAGVIDP